MRKRCYFAASIGNVTDEITAEYIEIQTLKASDEDNQDFSVEEH
jgi:hypothetical protein